MAQRSTFVTVVAWLFIILSGFTILILLMDAALFWTTPFEHYMARTAGQNGGPAMLGMARFIILLFLALAVWMLASSIGLLQRRNWARVSLMVILALALFWFGVSLIGELLALAGGHGLLSGAMVAGMPPGYGAFMHLFMLVFLILDVVFLVLFSWILKRLASAPVRREFIGTSNDSGTLEA